MNKLFVAYKPAEVSSNSFLSFLKRKYKCKKGGYSGTLDPFAKGVLIVAFGQFTKLFRFLDKTPKTYKATLWLGANSTSLDNKNIKEIKILPPFDLQNLEELKNSLLGVLEFTPPQFSAKRIEGKRAYEFAKMGIEAPLKTCKMQVFSCEILHYIHPFLSIKISVSEGAYIRSWAEMFAKKLGINATLSALERTSEGKFVYENEKSLEVLKYLNLKPNFLKDLSKLENGTKLSKDDLKFKENGSYFIEEENFFSVIEVGNEKITYLLNRIEKS